MDVITPEESANERYLLNDEPVSVKTIFDMVVIVLRKDGKQEQYDVIDITKDWIHLSYNDFIEFYGFEWQPSIEILKRIKEIEREG